MKQKLMLSIIFTNLIVAAIAQTANLPVKEWTSIELSPFILYISGDGGLNSFSTGLCNKINNAGYSVTAVNAKSYFWDKKMPEQAATAISLYIESKFHDRKNQELVLLGYSFGADVIPFIVNKFPDWVKKKLISIVLLSPSTSTDLEVHYSDMLGRNKKRSMDVVAEINRMGVRKTAIIFGTDERNFPVTNIHLRNYSVEHLPGGHHFDDNTDEVVTTIKKYFK